MIALIDYGAGNTASVANALKELKTEFIITSNLNEVDECEKIIFPGVGEATSAMNRVRDNNLLNLLQTTEKPLLGICLGMQLLGEFSEERNTKCIGVIPFTCKEFDTTDVKVPHMGWNRVKPSSGSPLFRGINSDDFFYFANSYYVPIGEYTDSTTEHGIRFSASIREQNYYGVQFHPEKSGKSGLKLLKNFLEL